MNILSVVNLRPIGWKLDLEAHAITFGSERFPMTLTGLPGIRFTHFTPVRSLSPLGNAYAIRHVDSPLYNEHCRLGHLGRDALVDLAKGGKLKYDLDVIKADEFKLSDCTSCLAASSKRLPKSGESPRGSADGEMVHVDLTGRMNPSIDGYEYALVMHADFTKVRAAVPIKLKSESVPQVQAFVARLETQSGIKVKVIRSDLGSEFSMKPLCDRTGIIHQTTPGYAPELNGVAERAVGILKVKAAVLSLSSPLGHPYWPYAIKYAAVILNKTTQSGIEGKTAWEVITGRQTNVDGIREYGEICFAHVPAELRTKASLDTPKARQARILGIEESTTGYIVRYEDNGAIGLSRDIRTATGVALDTPLQHVTPTPARVLANKKSIDPRLVALPSSSQPMVEPQALEKDVPAMQATRGEDLVPASASSNEPERGESNETPMVVQPTLQAPANQRSVS